MPFIRRRRSRVSTEPGPRVDRPRLAELRRFERHAAIRFRDVSLLNLALCHRSFAHEAGSGMLANNEKLEFLGDAVLGLAISDELYATSGRRTEGELARIKSFVVSEDTLYDWATQLRLQDFVLIGRGEELSGGRGKKAIVADAMEAIIGAYFLDAGRRSGAGVRAASPPGGDSSSAEQHPSAGLQDPAAGAGSETLSFLPALPSGSPGGARSRPDLLDRGKAQRHIYGPGSGKNKKEAEQEAASHAYAALNDSDSSTASPSGAAGGSSDRPGARSFLSAGSRPIEPGYPSRLAQTSAWRCPGRSGCGAALQS